MTRSSTPPGSRDVQFLTEEFGIPPFKAARLVAGKSELAEDLVDSEFQRQHDVDPLADVPTPKPSEHEFVADADEDQLKPVTRHNDLRGAG
jgi:hypothetical protein